MFMFLALHNTHVPVQAAPEFSSLYNFKEAKCNNFYGMVRDTEYYLY